MLWKAGYPGRGTAWGLDGSSEGFLSIVYPTLEHNDSPFTSLSGLPYKPTPSHQPVGRGFKESPSALSNSAYLSLVFPNHQLFTNPRQLAKVIEG